MTTHEWIQTSALALQCKLGREQTPCGVGDAIVFLALRFGHRGWAASTEKARSSDRDALRKELAKALDLTCCPGHPTPHSEQTYVLLLERPLSPWFA